MPAKTIVLALALVLANDSYGAKTFLDFTLSYHILTLSTGKKRTYLPRNLGQRPLST